MYYESLKTASANAIKNNQEELNIADRIDKSAEKIIKLFSNANIFPPHLTKNYLCEHIAEVQLKNVPNVNDLFLKSNDNKDDTIFTPMRDDEDIFGMLNELLSKIESLKDLSDLGVYHCSKVERNFESTNADNFLNTFKGIATEVGNLSMAAASGSVPSVDVSSIVNTITDSLSTAFSHSSDTLTKEETGRLIATKKGSESTAYIGILYHYKYILNQWTTCGVDHKKGYYSVKKSFFITNNRAQLRTLYSKVFSEDKEYLISLYYGAKVLEGSGPVLSSDQVDGRIISALGGTVEGSITHVKPESTAIFARRKANITIKESGVEALLTNEFKGMTLKKTFEDSDKDPEYYEIKIHLDVVK